MMPTTSPLAVTATRAVALAAGVLLAVPAFTASVSAAAKVGAPAPEFTAVDSTGKSHKLSDFRGKTVILEWTNDGCPYVKKHYDSGNMQKLQKEYTGKGVIWVAINSSAKGKQGNATPEEHNKAFSEKNAAPSVVLIDEDGKVGRQYNAKTTPDMFVIDKSGKLVYAGAIDDKSGVDQSEIASAKNYVKSALDEVLKGRTVTVAETKSYGCSVKYQ